MFLNKWTAQLNCPGQIVEEAFDSEDELMAFVHRMERESAESVRPIITVIDPEGNEKLVVPAVRNSESPL